MNTSPQTKKILIIASGHYIYDERVLRTVRIASNFGQCYYAVDKKYYQQFHNQSNSQELGIEKVSIFSLPDWNQTRIISRFYRYIYVFKIAKQAHKLEPQIVHIHESGSLGLLIAFFVKKFVPQAKIIFDYHDWIPFEVALLCRNIKLIYQIVLPIVLIWSRHLAKTVDTVICISPGQADWVKEKLGIFNTVVIQNVRDCLPPPDFSQQDLQHQIVFVGHVMRIRNLKPVIDVLAVLKTKSIHASFDIFGQVEEREYMDELLRYSKEQGVSDSIKFHGKYRDDSEIRLLVKRGAISIFFGFNDPLNTNINKIVSGNKLFTYLNLGIPVLLDSRYENMLKIVKEHSAGESFSDVKDIASQAEHIWRTKGLWDAMSKNAYSIATRMNSEIYRESIENLYK